MDAHQAGAGLCASSCSSYEYRHVVAPTMVTEVYNKKYIIHFQDLMLSREAGTLANTVSVTLSRWRRWRYLSLKALSE